MKFIRYPWQVVATVFVVLTQTALAAPGILFNEVMYNPPGTNVLEQWFELLNPATKAADISGWKTTKGVNFTFPPGTVLQPGAFLVVAADGATFRTQHPAVTNFVAGWTGKLNHHLELSDSSGRQVNAIEFYSEGDWAVRRMGPPMLNREGWEWYQPANGSGASLELINPVESNTLALNWTSSPAPGGTPGKQNAAFTNDAPPLITQVSHWPPIPNSTNAVTVTARIVDENSADKTVILNWRVDGESNFAELPMSDDGAHQDGIGQDGVYGATIPPHPDKTVIEFFIAAVDAAGHRRQYPNFVPPTDSTRTANLLFQVEDTVDGNVFPTYRLVMTEAERAYLSDLGRGCPDSDSDAQMNGTWITRDGVLSGGSNTQVRYNVGVRNRGHGTRTSVPHNYHVNIPDDRLWKNAAGIDLNSQYAHSQILGSAVMREANIAMPDSRAAKLRLNGVDLTASGGNSFGLYAANEQYNSDFFKRTFPLDPDGNAYRGIRDQSLCVPAINSVADLSWHGSNWNQSVYTNAYFRQNNLAATDYSDLLNLLAVLNLQDGTSAETYGRDVERTINVEEWMRYMAANTLLDNNETALANGVGDDYGLYRGQFDTRFLALPYDLDTVLGRGEANASPRDGIFRMNDLPVMDRFMKTPEFAPVYYKALRDLATTVFATEEMDPLIDQLLCGFVSPDAIANLKAFNASHRDYVLSQIPTALTVTSSLPTLSGYFHTSSALTSLNGTANAIDTRKILVNGLPANWIAWQGTWSLSNIVLNPGLNRLHVRALGTNDLEIQTKDVDVWLENGSGSNASPSINSDTHWTAVSGPYNVNTSLSINSGATLTIDPGTTVYLGSGANITVANGGRLLAEGTEQQPIRFTRAPGSSVSWGGIVINGGPNSAETRIIHAHLEFNGATAIHSSSGTLALDHLTFGSTGNQYVSLDSSSFIVSYCNFPTTTAAFEPTHGTGGIKAGGHGIFYRNFFGPPNGYNDVFDFTGGQRGAGAILYFVENVMSGGGDDGLDLDGTDAWVEGNIFMHIHQNGAPDSSSAISGGNTGADTSEITILGNLIFDCDNAGTAKQGNFFTLFNNTIVHMTKEGGNDFAASVVNVRDTTPDITTLGKGYYLEGNIIQDVQQLVRNNDPQAPVTFNNNILPIPWTGEGTKNYVGDPLLIHVPSVAEASFGDWEQAQIMWQWFSLKPGSPARKTGPNGKDKGGVVPLGAYLSGYPSGTNNSKTATITVGINRQGSGIVPPGWPSGAGFTAYRWRLDGSSWSAETPIATPIVVSGLSDGPHQVEVSGKTDSGLYQDDPLLGDAATVASTGTWYVDSRVQSPPPPTVWINELLANSPETNGISAPDFVEFRNYGSQEINLDGFHLTPNLQSPDAFTFPVGTKLGPKAYLVLAADTDFSAPGAHLGFNLSANGDALYLLDPNGAKVDSVAFGRQIPGSSIGRAIDGTWTLCIPTLGADNIPEALGDARQLRVNEWLADRAYSAPNSFVELYNLSTNAVDLGGLGLSDAAGTPNRYLVPDLSFIEPEGYAAFIADGQNAPGHLNFKLTPDVGLISLMRGVDIIDSVEYGSQTTDVSEGRSPNGSGTIAFFNQPTPGAPNPGGGSSTITNITRNTTTVVPIVTSWKYNEAGVSLGATWRDSTYDDASWSTGNALFYHGNGAAKMPVPIGTTLTFQNPEQWTYYFRKHFTYDGTMNGLSLTLSEVIDDGIVVYLNGAEVYRRNIAPGTVQFTTPAQTTVSDATEFHAANVPATGLVSGDNDIAVEVHQANLTSSDIAMALGVDVVSSVTNSVGTGASAPAVVINEVFARNATVRDPKGEVTDWIELYNPSTNRVDLEGISITDDVAQPSKWVFAPGSAISPNGYLMIDFNPDAPRNTNNTALKLGENGATIYLFDSRARGGALLDSIRYGIQVPDLSLARVPDGTGGWTLATPTPEFSNSAVTLGSPGSLRINEWMASASDGGDWLEIYSADSNPVSLGDLYLTDSLTDRTRFRIEPLSFVGTGQHAFVRFEADSAPELGANHVGFNLSAKGEEIGLYDSTGYPLDSIVFGTQSKDVSQGRLPDGTGPITDFPRSASPGDSNYLPLVSVQINEILSNPSDGATQEIELYNSASSAIDLSGWFLSRSTSDLQGFKIPAATSIPAHGYLLFHAPLALNATNGGTLILSAADLSGALTGFRGSVTFGSSDKGVSFGTYQTSVGTDFTALNTFTPGATNSGPKVGPVVISEIMADPIALNEEDLNLEFLELENISGTTVPLYDSVAPANPWTIQGAVHYAFKTNMILAAGERILLVGFDPANSALTAQFKSRYSVPPATRIFGPWNGKLGNVSETVRLVRPSSTAPGTGPGIDVDRVVYATSAPWPTGNIGIDSLQRVQSNAYGNDPINWKAAAPTAGGPNNSQTVSDSDNDGLPDDWELSHFGTLNRDGTADFDGDGLTDKGEFLAGTDPTNPNDFLRLVLAQTPGNSLLQFTAVAEHSYRLEYTDQLASGTWQTLQEIPPASSTHTMQLTDPTAGNLPARFYRLRLF